MISCYSVFFFVNPSFNFEIKPAIKIFKSINLVVWPQAAINVEELIQIGDEIEVDMLGTLDYDWRGQVDDDGFLSDLPQLTEPIAALCRSVDETAADVRAAYNRFLRNPQIVVRVTDRSRRQSSLILGAIQIPQQFKIERAVRLTELIVLSGGITDKASGTIRILRPARLACVAPGKARSEFEDIKIKIADLLAGKPEANPLVHSGDVITIEESAIVYLIGDVAAPQRVRLRQGTTLSRALASAGGLSGKSQTVKITIFRRGANNSENKTIITKLNKIAASQDVELQANDVVEISQNDRQQNRRPPLIVNETEQSKAAVLPVRIIN